MTILWLAALSRLSANGNIILDLRRKIRDQIAAVATWKGCSPLLTKFSPSVSGGTRVAWTGTIPFKEIPPTRRDRLLDRFTDLGGGTASRLVWR